MLVSVCVCVCPSPINFRTPEPRFIKLGTYITAPEPISTAQLKNPSVKNPPIVARQRLGRNVTAVTNIHATTEELLDASFLMWPVSYQGR
jgi:hypothetical protein